MAVAVSVWGCIGVVERPIRQGGRARTGGENEAAGALGVARPQLFGIAMDRRPKQRAMDKGAAWRVGRV